MWGEGSELKAGVQARGSKLGQVVVQRLGVELAAQGWAAVQELGAEWGAGAAYGMALELAVAPLPRSYSCTSRSCKFQTRPQGRPGRNVTPLTPVQLLVSTPI